MLFFVVVHFPSLSLVSFSLPFSLYFNICLRNWWIIIYKDARFIYNFSITTEEFFKGHFKSFNKYTFSFASKWQSEINIYVNLKKGKLNDIIIKGLNVQKFILWDNTRIAFRKEQKQKWWHFMNNNFIEIQQNLTRILANGIIFIGFEIKCDEKLLENGIHFFYFIFHANNTNFKLTHYTI